jgi:N-carbamoyl-D-amino-acid hydrolase
MSRFVTVGAAQMGPIARTESRKAVVSRLMELMREAKSFNCDVVVFPELALTTFFPRWAIEDEGELDSFYETEMPGPIPRHSSTSPRSSASASAWAMPNW